MDTTPSGSTDWRRAPAENFVGEVWMGPLSEPTDGEGVTVLAVQFAPEARTDWHSHPAGQVLYGVSGTGVVVDETGGATRISVGDTVTAPAGRLHWHGSAGPSPMMHLSITSGGPTEWSRDKVSDTQYEEGITAAGEPTRASPRAV